MAATLKINKFIFRLGYFVAFITLLSIFLLSQATEGSEKFERIYQYLLVSTLIGISCLFVIVFSFLWQTYRNYKNGVAGATLSLSILGRTLLLAIIPLFFIAFFSFKFLRYEFQSSFDKGINNALTSALVLSQKALNIRAIQALNKSKNVSKIISHFIAPLEYKPTLQKNLENMREKVHASELAVFDEQGFIQAFSSNDPNTIIPLIPEHSDFSRAENDELGGIFVIESEKDKFKIRVLTDINRIDDTPTHYLQSVYYISDNISELTNQINKTITERDRINYLMPKVNNSFIFVLILVLLLACLLLILSSISFANNMVQPIRDLIKGTKNVSQGDFNQKIIVKRKDDFGTLINSFNQMTKYLKLATEEVSFNKEKVERERAYLATVIKHMTSAVITLDFKGRLLTFNERAEKLLECSLDKAANHEIDKLDLEFEYYKNFISQLKIGEKIDQEKEKEIQISQAKKTKFFIAKLTALPLTDNFHGGYVIIFDEFGEYLQRQKQKAWEEVARRLAHEIKNPLTPILLAAERLNYKLSEYLPEKEKKVLKRSTDVISNQVKSLKNMVNDFSNYAKPITAKKTNLSLNLLIKDVFDLYKGHYEGIKFTLSIQANEDLIFGNINLLRQTIHNLIKNAIEACENTSEGDIAITSKNENNHIVFSINDNGSGLSDLKNDVFEPYITTKEKGTGLGLPIVKKIIDEHNGTIKLINKVDEPGVLAIVSLPLAKN